MDPVAWTQAQLGDLQQQIAKVSNSLRVLEEQRRGLEDQRRDLEEQVRHLEAWLKLYASSTRNETVLSGLAEPASDKHEAADLRRGTIADACATILRELREATTVQLAERLMTVGKVKPDNPRTAYATVYGALQRQPQRFKRIGRGQWALADGLPAQEPESTRH